jgi:rhamnose transport system permease protein
VNRRVTDPEIPGAALGADETRTATLGELELVPQSWARRLFGRLGTLGQGFREAGIVLFMLVAVAFFATQSPAFLTIANFRSILVNGAIVIVLASGLTALVVARQIDISIGSTVGLTAYVSALVMADLGDVPFVLVALLAVALGSLLGLVNGLLVAVLRIPAIIATLGALFMYRGAIFLVQGGRQINAHELPHAFLQLSRMTVARVPILIWVSLSIAVVVGLALAYTRWGRDLYAIGSNPQAAGYVGLHPRRLVIGAFVLMGALAGLGGFLYVLRFATVNVGAATGLEFDVVAAVVIGGVNIFGGAGRVFGAVLGAILLSMLARGLILMHIPEFWKVVLTGAAIVGALALDAFLTRRRQERLRTARRPHLEPEAGA